MSALRSWFWLLNKKGLWLRTWPIPSDRSLYSIWMGLILCLNICRWITTNEPSNSWATAWVSAATLSHYRYSTVKPRRYFIEHSSLRNIEVALRFTFFFALHEGLRIPACALVILIIQVIVPFITRAITCVCLEKWTWLGWFAAVAPAQWLSHLCHIPHWVFSINTTIHFWLSTLARHSRRWLLPLLWDLHQCHFPESKRVHLTKRIE